MSYPIPENGPSSLSDYVDIGIIGAGNFSVIHSARELGTSKFVALKKYDKLYLHKFRKIDDVFMERHALGRLCHRNVVRLISTFSDIESIYIVTELGCKGDLWSSCRGWGHPEAYIAHFTKQIATALQYIHRSGIAHRDIKAENIILFDRLVVKLGDFGSSVDNLNPKIQASTTPSFRKRFKYFVGTPNFMAPEVIANTINDCISDIWSFGCTIYQILLGIPPFVASSQYFVFLRIREHDLIFPIDGISARAAAFVVDIMVRDRKMRPTIEQILRHPFLIDDEVEGPRQLSNEEAAALQIFQQADVSDLEAQLVDARMEEKEPSLFRRILWARDWNEKSKEGAGAAALLHLNIPELAIDYIALGI